MKNALKKKLSMACALIMLLGVVTIMPGARSRADATLVAGDELPTTSGTYVLGASIEVTQEAVIESGENVVIDLNGNTLHMSDSSRFYTIKGTLTVTDTSAQQAGCFIGNNSIPAGTNGGIFLVESGGTLNLENGSLLTGKVSASSPNIYSAAGFGGAVYCKGTFNMSGGSIKGCSAEAGGAVYVESGATFNMSGGELQLNSATSAGGGICVSAAMGPATLKLSGNASIYENSCAHSYPLDPYSPLMNSSASGGGICVIYSPAVQISGNVAIYDNTCGFSSESPRNNLYLTSPGTVITISGNLGSGANIYLDRADTTIVSGMDDDAETLTSGLSGNGTAGSFTCERANFSFVTNADGELIFHDDSQQEEKTLGISGYNVSLGGDIALHAYITVPEDKDVSKLSVSASYSYTVEKNGKNKTETKTFSFESSDMTLDPDLGYKIDVPVESACMTSDITFTLTYDGEELPTTYTTTINAYANSLLGKTTTSSEDKTILQNLLIYGLYAQKQFEINTGLLPSGTSAYPVVWSENGPSSNLSEGYFVGFPNPEHKDLYIGTSVVFLTTNKIKFYFSEAVDFAVQYDGQSSWTEITPKKSGGNYIYIVDGPNGNGFPAATYADAFSIRIGTTEYPLWYSIKVYLQSVMYSQTTSRNMKNLAKAYFRFASNI